MLKYSKSFGTDIHFNKPEIYKDFVKYSIEEGKHLESLKYRNKDIIQLEILNNKNKDEIFRTRNMIKFIGLNSYDRGNKLIEQIIKYQKDNGKKNLFFSLKTFGFLIKIIS